MSEKNGDNTESFLQKGLETEKENNFFQIDFMKCFMMVLVILDHSTTHSYMHQFYSPLWQRIAIPLFLVIMGFNMGISFKKKGFDNKSIRMR